MLKLNKFIDQWNRFWFRSGPPHALALLRIAFALYLLAEACTYLPVVPRMFSTEALTFSWWAPRAPEWLQPLLELPPPHIAWVIASVYVAACVCLLLGYGMRVSIGVLVVLFLYYWQLSFFLFPSSYHRIYLFVLLVLWTSGADKTFSLRMLRTHGSVYAWEPISVFHQRLLAVQLSVTYFGVGLQKAWLPAWVDGRALSLSLVGRWATPAGRWVVQQNYPLWVFTAGVWWVKLAEVFMAFCFWIKRWRWWCVAAGILFHGGIAVLMSIWWFLALVPAYIVYWQPEEVYNACKRWLPGKIL